MTSMTADMSLQRRTGQIGNGSRVVSLSTVVPARQPKMWETKMCQLDVTGILRYLGGVRHVHTKLYWRAPDALRGDALPSQPPGRNRLVVILGDDPPALSNLEPATDPPTITMATSTVPPEEARPTDSIPKQKEGLRQTWRRHETLQGKETQRSWL